MQEFFHLHLQRKSFLLSRIPYDTHTRWATIISRAGQSPTKKMFPRKGRDLMVSFLPRVPFLGGRLSRKRLIYYMILSLLYIMIIYVRIRIEDGSFPFQFGDALGPF